jgi:hypothetical protein
MGFSAETVLSMGCGWLMSGVTNNTFPFLDNHACCFAGVWVEWRAAVSWHQSKSGDLPGVCVVAAMSLLPAALACFVSHNTTTLHDTIRACAVQQAAKYAFRAHCKSKLTAVPHR